MRVKYINFIILSPEIKNRFGVVYNEGKLRRTIQKCTTQKSPSVWVSWNFRLSYHSLFEQAPAPATEKYCSKNLCWCYNNDFGAENVTVRALKTTDALNTFWWIVVSWIALLFKWETFSSSSRFAYSPFHQHIIIIGVSRLKTCRLSIHTKQKILPRFA